MSGKARPIGLHRLQSKKGSDITAVGLAASALEEAFMYLGVVPQVQLHHTPLVIRSRKVVRKSASGAVRRYFGGERCTTSSAANASDIGACKSWKPGERLVLALVWCLERIIKRHTYRMQEIRVRRSDVRRNCSSSLLRRRRSNRSRR